MPGEPDDPQLIRVIGDMVDEAAKANEVQAHATPAPGSKSKPKQRQEPERGREADGTFYVYVDNAGTEHIVDSLELVPKKFRKGAKRWIMPVDGDDEQIETQISDGIQDIAKTVESVAAPAPTTTHSEDPGLHVPSFLIGVVVAAVLFVGSLVLRNKTSFLVKVVLAAVAAAILTVGYLGWVRRQAGLGDGPIAQPKAVLDDAHHAAELLEQRNQQQERLLDELEEKPDKIIFP